MNKYFENHRDFKYALDLFKSKLKDQTLTKKFIPFFCCLYIIIMWSSFLFSILFKGMHLQFVLLLDKLDNLETYSWKALYNFLVWGLNKTSKSLKFKTTKTEVPNKGMCNIIACIKTFFFFNL